MSRDVQLPSGAILKVNPAPFKDAKALYQALLAEFRSVPVSTDMDMMRLFKDLFCTGFSSAAIESALWKCFARCTYNDLKVTEESFEPIEQRQDFMVVCKEVAQDNVAPFMKSLSDAFNQFLSMTGNIQPSLLKTMNSSSSASSAKPDTPVQ